MATLKVLSDGRVVEHLFNPAPDQVVAEVEIKEPAIPFSPLTFMTDGRVEEGQRLRAIALQQAEELAQSTKYKV
jgi:hypothetical protein